MIKVAGVVCSLAAFGGGIAKAEFGDFKIGPSELLYIENAVGEDVLYEGVYITPENNKKALQFLTHKIEANRHHVQGLEQKVDAHYEQIFPFLQGQGQIASDSLQIEMNKAAIETLQADAKVIKADLLALNTLKDGIEEQFSEITTDVYNIVVKNTTQDARLAILEKETDANTADIAILNAANQDLSNLEALVGNAYVEGTPEIPGTAVAGYLQTQHDNGEIWTFTQTSPGYYDLEITLDGEVTDNNLNNGQTQHISFLLIVKGASNQTTLEFVDPQEGTETIPAVAAIEATGIIGDIEALQAAMEAIEEGEAYDDTSILIALEANKNNIKQNKADIVTVATAVVNNTANIISLSDTVNNNGEVLTATIENLNGLRNTVNANVIVANENAEVIASNNTKINIINDTVNSNVIIQNSNVAKLNLNIPKIATNESDIATIKTDLNNYKNTVNQTLNGHSSDIATNTTMVNAAVFAATNNFNQIQTNTAAIEALNGGSSVEGPQGPKGEAGLDGTQISINSSSGEVTIDGEITANLATQAELDVVKDTAYGKINEHTIKLSSYFNLIKTNKDDIANLKANGVGGTGPQGEQGIQGETGATGAQGAKGDTGAQGIQGLKGDKGEKGENGIDGVDGATGLTGAKGDRGEDGIDGQDGATGAQGEQGEAGFDGIDGITGDTGAKGEKGERGENGADGRDGIDGSDGADGKDGADGIDGSTFDDKPILETLDNHWASIAANAESNTLDAELISENTSRIVALEEASVGEPVDLSGIEETLTQHTTDISNNKNKLDTTYDIATTNFNAIGDGPAATKLEYIVELENGNYHRYLEKEIGSGTFTRATYNSEDVPISLNIFTYYTADVEALDATVSGGATTVWDGINANAEAIANIEVGEAPDLTKIKADIKTNYEIGQTNSFNIATEFTKNDVDMATLNGAGSDGINIINDYEGANIGTLSEAAKELIKSEGGLIGEVIENSLSIEDNADDITAINSKLVNIEGGILNNSNAIIALQNAGGSDYDDTQVKINTADIETIVDSIGTLFLDDAGLRLTNVEELAAKNAEDITKLDTDLSALWISNNGKTADIAANKAAIATNTAKANLANNDNKLQDAQIGQNKDSIILNGEDILGLTGRVGALETTDAEIDEILNGEITQAFVPGNSND